jgi:hypothetical protein
MRRKSLLVTDLPVPEPGPGEVLVKTLACGICGSDLHALKHAEKLVESARRSGSPFVMDLSRDIVMGHEFCAEIVDHGTETTKALKTGTRVCSLPVLIRPSGVETVGYSNDNPGGYGEYMRLTEALLLEVPGGLSAEHAALTEPLAVGVHAVEKARLETRDVPLVIGCGPVGLAVIAALRLKDVHPIVAADFSKRHRARRRRRRRSRGEVALRELEGSRDLGRSLGGAAASAVDSRAGAAPGGDLRVRRDPRRDRQDHGVGAGRGALGGRRRVHGARCDRADVRHQQGAEHPIRARLHARGVRRDVGPHRRR